MKISISLSEQDVATLDEYARAIGLPSRSAAVQQAIRALRLPDLEDDYAAAWDEWAQSGDEADWEGLAGDGLLSDVPSGSADASR